MPSSNPPYIDKPMLDVLPQPVVITDADMYGFVLKGNTQNIARCIQSLNDGGKPKVQYYPVTPYVLFSFVDLKTIKSGMKPYSDLGAISEREATIFVWLVAGHKAGHIVIGERLAIHVPYIFVDDSYALTAGREIFGFPKQWAWLDLPSDPNNLSPITVDTSVIEHYAPTARASRERLFTVTPSGALNNTLDPWQTLEDGLEELRDLIFGSGDIIIPGWQMIPNLFSDLVTQSIPVAFLKEFRSIEKGTEAAYRAVAESPVKLNKLHEIKRLDQEFELQINRYDSHPIADMLGLTPTSGTNIYKPELSFYTRFDMTFENGKVIHDGAKKGLFGWLNAIF